jgi:hypothetical protein
MTFGSARPVACESAWPIAVAFCHDLDRDALIQGLFPNAVPASEEVIVPERRARLTATAGRQ